MKISNECLSGLIDEGFSQSQIARTCNLSRQAISKRIKYKKRKSSVLFLYRIGFTIPEMARLIGYKEGTIIVYLSRLGYSAKGRCKGVKWRRGKRTPPSKLRANLIKKYGAQVIFNLEDIKTKPFWNLTDLGDKYGFSREYARQIFTRFHGAYKPYQIQKTSKVNREINSLEKYFLPQGREVGEMKDYFCIDCGKLLEQITPGVIAEAWLRTDGDSTIIKPVPGGVVIGKELGFVCNNCSAFGTKG